MVRNSRLQKAFKIVGIFILSIILIYAFYSWYLNRMFKVSTTVSSRVSGVTDSTPVAGFPTVNSYVYALALSEDGNTLYLGGSFTRITDSVDTYVRNSLAAIDLETLTVTSWNPSATGLSTPDVYDIEVSGSDVYVGGTFTYVDGESRSRIAKVNNTDGSVDLAWNPSSNNSVWEIEVSGSDVYVGGYFTFIGGETRNTIAKLNNTDGSADSQWDPNAENNVFAIELDGENMYVGGAFDYIDYTLVSEFAQLNLEYGQLTDSCYPNIVTQSYCTLYPEDPSCEASTVYSIRVVDDDIYVSGSFTNVGGISGDERLGLAKLNKEDCSLASWNPTAVNDNGDNPYVYTMEFSGTEVYVGGNFASIGGESRNNLAVLDSTTGLAGTWNPNIGGNYVKDMVISDNYLIVGGQFSTVGGEEVWGLTAFPYTPPVTLEEDIPTSATVSTSSPEVIQIPAMRSVITGPIVAAPSKESNTGGQGVLVIVHPGIFNFDAFISSNVTEPKKLVQSVVATNTQGTGVVTNLGTIPSLSNLVFAGGADRTIIGVKESKGILWQVGNIEEMWYKSYPAVGHSSAIIIPDLQKKDSIIAFKYTDNDLIPPGVPNSKFVETKLKLAHSLDGKNWTVIPSSVVDPINNTVAGLGKVGGYYMIVGKY